MDSTIITGLIGALSTIIAAIASPYFANKVQEQKKSKYMPVAPIARQNALFGTWVGTIEQKVGIERVLNNRSPGLLKLHFTEISHPMIGEMKVEFKTTGDEILDEDRFIEAKIVNTIYDGRIFKCDYINKDNNAIHFGTLYGELFANGKEIKGEFLGYGLISEQFVSGEIELKKQLIVQP